MLERKESSSRESARTTVKWESSQGSVIDPEAGSQLCGEILWDRILPVYVKISDPSRFSSVQSLLQRAPVLP
jgi:hypothetical protein